ncbi:MAG: methyltransferase type 11 [Frankiales bacterium]|nr:methyltransferase type 11 [Frankiales bacterium]
MSVDYAVITGRQQRVWSLGDYGKVGSLLSWLGESLVRRLDVHAGEAVLDVAAGNSNASLPAARRFADVLATDYVPALLDEARARADADGVRLRTQVADAQALPFDDGTFDVVMSTIGAMFAPDQEALAREMSRVCRSGGRIGMANWTPDSMVGDMFRAVGAHVPPPQGVLPASMWATGERVHELFGPYCKISTSRETCPFRFPSPQACLDYFRTWYGPTVAAFRGLDDDGQASLADGLLEVFTRHGSSADGTMAADVSYLEVIAYRS